MSENDFKSSIQNLDYDNIKFLILQGYINVDSKELTNDNDPLIILLKTYRKIELHNKVTIILQYLINSGFNVHAIDSNGNTPIHHAMKNGYIESIVILLNNKANLALKNNFGLTPIMLALEIKKMDLLDLVIPEEFIDVDTQDNNAKEKDLIKVNQNINDFIDKNGFPLLIQPVAGLPEDVFEKYLKRTIINHFKIDSNLEYLKKIVRDEFNKIIDVEGLEQEEEEKNIFSINNAIIKDIIDKISPNLQLNDYDYDLLADPVKFKKFFDDKAEIINPQTGGSSQSQNNIYNQFDRQLNININNHNQILQYVFKELEILIYNYLLQPDEDNYGPQTNYVNRAGVVQVLANPATLTQSKNNLHNIYRYFKKIYETNPPLINNPPNPPIRPPLLNLPFIERGLRNELEINRYTGEFGIQINKNNFISPSIINRRDIHNDLDVRVSTPVDNAIKNPVNNFIEINNDYYAFDLNVDAMETISNGLFNVNSNSQTIQKNITRNLNSRYILDNINEPIPVPAGRGIPPTRGYTNFIEEPFTLGVIVDPFTSRNHIISSQPHMVHGSH